MCLVEGDYEISEDLFSYYFNKQKENSNLSSNFIHCLFQSFDRDKNEKLNFCEFLVGLTFFKSDDHEKNLKVFFRLFDLNNDKFIRKNEIELILKTLDKFSDMKLSFHETMIKDLDLNDDDQIDEDEFITGIIRNPNYVELLKLIQQ